MLQVEVELHWTPVVLCDVRESSRFGQDARVNLRRGVAGFGCGYGYDNQ
jgi:hypothetical protein